MESYLQQHNAALPEAAPLPCHGLTNLYQLAAESTLAYISDLENGAGYQRWAGHHPATEQFLATLWQQWHHLGEGLCPLWPLRQAVGQERYKPRQQSLSDPAE